MRGGGIAKMRIDMKGKICGKLTVIEKKDVYKGYDTRWLCKCSCGSFTVVRGSFLRNGHTKSCGNCIRYEEEKDGIIKCTVGSGRSFIFEAQDYNLVSKYRWSVTKDGYVLGTIDGGIRVKLHRLLMGNPQCVVDHINGNPDDCRRSNLRCATQQQNTQNSILPKSSTTGFKGVCFDKQNGKFMAHIHPNGKMKFLGYYISPIEAALAYDKAASLYFGEFAKPNFTTQKERKPNEEILELG